MDDELGFSQPLGLSLGDDDIADEYSDYLLLKRALQNEKAAPELLPYEDELIQRINALLEHQVRVHLIIQYHYPNTNPHKHLHLHQEQVVQSAESRPDHDLVCTIYTVEITRVKYMLRSYLRTRLFKIGKYVMHSMDDPEVRSRLSPLEDQYAEQYLRLIGNHLANTVSAKLPEAFKSVFKQASAHQANDMIPAPDLGTHVFTNILRDLGQVQVYEDGSSQEMFKGDTYIMRYAMLRRLLQDGSVQLM